jgi:hypothetical protein
VLPLTDTGINSLTAKITDVPVLLYVMRPDERWILVVLLADVALASMAI